MSATLDNKENLDGKILFPSSGALDPGIIAMNLGKIIYKKFVVI